MKRIRRLDEATPGLSDYRDVERDHPGWIEFRSHQEGAAFRELPDALIEKQRDLCGYCETDLPSSTISPASSPRVAGITTTNSPTSGRTVREQRILNSTVGLSLPTRATLASTPADSNP